MQFIKLVPVWLKRLARWTKERENPINLSNFGPGVKGVLKEGV